MVMPVGKVGAPGHEELAVGAVAPGGVTVLNQGVIAALRLPADRVHELVQPGGGEGAAPGRGLPGRSAATAVPGGTLCGRGR